MSQRDPVNPRIGHIQERLQGHSQGAVDACKCDECFLFAEYEDAIEERNAANEDADKLEERYDDLKRATGWMS